MSDAERRTTVRLIPRLTMKGRVRHLAVTLPRMPWDAEPEQAPTKASEPRGSIRPRHRAGDGWVR